MKAVPIVLLLMCGCASVPHWVPFFGRTYAPYIENPQFSCEYPLKWGKGKRIPGGVEFKEPHGRVFFSIAFLASEDPTYKSADHYRQEMSDWGAVEDEHRVSDIFVSSHTAYRVRFTTYKYSPEYMLGAVPPQVLFTEKILVVHPKGVYWIVYSGDKEHFWRRAYRRYYEYFLRSVELPGLEKKRLRPAR